MGNPKGFLKIKRSKINSDGDVRDQAARCMDCGTPFCHWACPIGNYIPEWNDLVYGEHYERAYELLSATNCLPEVTGRVCPALCEAACVLGINDDPITVRENELAIIEKAFKQGFVRPNLPKHRSGKKVAIVGSGPAGLSCAAQLNKLGHLVAIFEKADNIGGIMRYGIPDFKLEKKVLDRRIEIWEKEGIEFKTNINVGENFPVDKLLSNYDAVCLAGGSRVPRDLNVPGRDLKGIVFAMDYLTQSNHRVAGKTIPDDQIIDAKGKKVLVIGGGDTGSDCVGTANRQGAKCVVQIEVLPKPLECRSPSCPWPQYPILLKTTSSHEEGCERQWGVLTKGFLGDREQGIGGRVKKLSCVKVDANFKELPNSAFEIEADLVILAVGFVHPEKIGLIQALGVELDQRGNVKTNNSYGTSVNKVFAAGDMHRGQSLIVWALWEGGQAALEIDRYLRGKE